MPQIRRERSDAIPVYQTMPSRLTATPAKLLAHFRQNTGKVLTRDDIARAVWNQRIDPRSRCIDQAVASIRKDLPGPERIETVMGFGYRHEERR